MSEILESVHRQARQMHSLGIIDKTTMREFDILCLPTRRVFAPDDIKALRERSNTSQAVFAACLNVRPVTVAAWEQGTKKPTGSALKLLDLIDRKGLDILL